MKKIICFLGSLIAGIIILCVPSFAADSSTVKFDEYFAPHDIILGGLTGGQYIEVYDSETRVYTATHDYAFETLKYWGAYCRVKFKPEGIAKDTRLRFNMKVNIYLDDKIVNANNIYPKIQVKDGGSWANAGSHTVLKKWDSTDKTISMLYKVDYTFKNDTDFVMFTFDYPSHDQTLSVFRTVQYYFPESVTNFSFNIPSGADAPIYSGVDSDAESELENVEGLDSEILDSTNQGKAESIDLLVEVAELLVFFSIPLTALARLFNYIFECFPMFANVFRISLVFGLLGFFLNIVGNFSKKGR